MTDPPMYIVASAVLCRSLAIVWSLPLPGCGLMIYILLKYTIRIYKLYTKNVLLNFSITKVNKASIAVFAFV